jgi:hypothetical protein
MAKTAALAKAPQPSDAAAKHTPPANDTAPSASRTRHDLAELKMDLREAERAALAARAPVARLEAEIADEAAARDLLAELDADYAARIAAWAASGSDPGAAPEPRADRPEAEAALATASLRAEAARTVLAAARQAIAEADARVGALKARARPAVAAVLREEGAWLVAEYWRRYADLEQVRRELTALDEVLIAEFPVIHAPTGRTVVEWLSPAKLPAAAALDAAEAACAGLDHVPEFARYWRARAEELAG